MNSLNRITYLLLYLMLLSPILSYITFGLMGLQSITYYFTIITFFYGIFFIVIKGKAIKFPRILYLLILYSIYLSIWSFSNGGFERRGFIQVIMNKDILSIIFIIIIIYNTNFSEQFIKRSLIVIKITVILATIVSLIQVVDYSFLDANPIWAKGEVGDTLLGDLYLDRRASIFGYVNPNEIGLSYIPLLSILIGVQLHKQFRFYYVFLLLGGISAFLTNARYVMVAFVLITLQIIITNKTKFSELLKYIIIISISGILIIQILSFYGYNFNEWYHTRLFAEGSLKETTRYKAFGTFMMFFPQKPLFGFGGATKEMFEASNEVGSSQIHVGYLAHLAYYGIVGSFLLFGFWFSLARKLYRNGKLTNYWGSFYAFLAFLWANTVLVNFSVFFYGIIFALVFDKYFTSNLQNEYTKNSS